MMNPMAGFHSCSARLERDELHYIIPMHLLPGTALNLTPSQDEVFSASLLGLFLHPRSIRSESCYRISCRPILCESRVYYHRRSRSSGAFSHCYLLNASNLRRPLFIQNSLSASAEVAIVIGLMSCPSTSSPCPSPDDRLGTILYNGPYHPQYQSNSPHWKPPHQNFTIAIPTNVPAGNAQLNVAHIGLIGVRLPFYIATSRNS